MQPASNCHCEVEQDICWTLQMCAQRVGDGMATRAAKWRWIGRGSTCWSAPPAPSLVRQASIVVLDKPHMCLLPGITTSEHRPFENTCWRREHLVSTIMRTGLRSGICDSYTAGRHRSAIHSGFACQGPHNSGHLGCPNPCQQPA